MIGLLVLLTTLILVCAIGFVVIYQKLDKKSSTQDINLTVNIPPQKPNPIFIEGTQQSINHDKGLIDYTINPMDYINKTETKAHIIWEDTEQKNLG
jgi:hypothetical protein